MSIRTKDTATRRNLILEGNLFKAIITLSIPIVINSFIQTMYNLTDTYWLGQIGTDPMAAITLVSPVQNIIMNFGMGITTAGAVLISQYLGAKEDGQARSMASHICIAAAIFSIVCAFLCYLGSPMIVQWLGAEGYIRTYGTCYLEIVVLDMPFLFMINIFTAVYQAQGDTLKPMLLNLLGVIINMILDPLFMIVFDWHIAGAALATLLAKIPSALIATSLLFNKKQFIHVTFKKFRFQKDKLVSILKIGLPTAIGSSTMQLGFLLMTSNVLAYGPVGTAAYGIGNKINGIISLPSTGIGSATSTIVGQNMGAHQVDRAKAGYRLALKIAVSFLFVGGLILSRRFVSEPIASIFTDDPKVITLATDYLSLMALCCWTNGIYDCTTGLFRGSGHTMVTMAVDASRMWVFRFLILFICRDVLGLGIESIWIAVVGSNAISAFILFFLYKTNIWRKSTVKIQKSAATTAASDK